MIKKDILKKLIEDNYSNDNYEGINISMINNELLIKGNKSDLLELANYIVDVALSDNNNDHIHLDKNTLMSNDSNINELIIEKEG